jgi:hypothetical protein
MIQIGAYSEFWPDIHMTPEEGMRAHLDLQGGQPHGVLLPIHWGTFNLALHPWAEPGEWTADEGEAVGQTVATPRPGEPFEPGGDLVTNPWWRSFGGTFAHHWRTPKPIGTEPKPTTTPVELDLANER